MEFIGVAGCDRSRDAGHHECQRSFHDLQKRCRMDLGSMATTQQRLGDSAVVPFRGMTKQGTSIGAIKKSLLRFPPIAVIRCPDTLPPRELLCRGNWRYRQLRQQP